MKPLEKRPFPGAIEQAESSQLPTSQSEQARKLEQSFPAPNLVKSFSHAFYGIKETWLSERNFRVQTACAAAAIFLAFLLKIDLLSWLTLTLVISFVLTAELINTALEHIVDLAANSIYHPLAKAAKDAAAGAVLVASLGALTTGLIIFAPRLLPLCQQGFTFLAH